MVMNPTLKTVESTIINVDYNDLEDFIREVYGVNYSIPCGEEISNDSKKSYNVSAANVDKFKIREFKKLKSSDEVDEGFYLIYILNDCCANGLIKPGTYLVNVCW